MLRHTYSRTTSVFALLVLVATAAHAADMPDARDIVKDTFKVRPGGTLHLDIDFGEVQVISAPGSEVLVEVERTAQTSSQSDAKEAFSRHNVSLQQRGNDVRVEARMDEDDSAWGRWRDKTRMKVRVFVRVPDSYNVEFTSGAGNVDLAGLTGRINGRTGAGNLKVTRFRGNADITTGAGNVTVDQAAAGRLDVSTGAGNVELIGVQGAVSANSGAGNITAQITRQPDAPSELHSGAGNVTVHLGRQIRANVDAEAGIGSINTDFPLKVEGNFMSKSCEGPINGGGPPLRMRTGVGNVTLRKI